MVERLSIDKVRFFRVERTYAVKTGKWYFEFEAVTGGDMKVGWARPGCKPDVELGTDELAFVFDGYKVSCQPDQISKYSFTLCRGFHVYNPTEKDLLKSVGFNFCEEIT